MRFARSKTSVSVSVSQSQLEKKEIEMVRVPCCDKMGLKRGPWTPEEDHVLVSYIQRFGHGNWRALPQHAGLMRCGKSCRLRWTNYLRPDIKRGNFSEEEEDTIIKLHEMLGNRWSAIAARIPGRTDNEIKNVWHTRLKKKLKQNQTDTADTRKPRKPTTTTETSNPQTHTETEFKPNPKSKIKIEPVYALMSPQQSCTSTEMSTGTESGLTTEKVVDIKEEEFIIDSWDTLPQADESLWSQFMPVDNFETLDEFSSANTTSLLQFPLPSSTSPILNDLDFWHDIFMKAGEISELPEF